MSGLRGAALIAATITMGLIAGLFYAFACSVVLGLGRAGDRTFVDATQRTNAAILNGWFFLSFLGALVLTALALPLEGRPVLPWIAATAAFGCLTWALVLYGRGAAPGGS